MAINYCVIARVLIGLLFIASGFEKLIGSYQNFLYVVQGYDLFGVFLENIIARTLPWIELFLGAFLLLGFWTRVSLKALMVLTIMFIFVVSQAIARGLPITECGCFGEFISVPLYVILLFDSALLLLMDSLRRRQDRTEAFSLDRYFVS